MYEIQDRHAGCVFLAAAGEFEVCPTGANLVLVLRTILSESGVRGGVGADLFQEGGIASGVPGEDAFCDGLILGGHLAAQDHQEALEAAKCHAGCVSLALTGEFAVVTICHNCFLMLRAIFYESFKCLSGI